MKSALAFQQATIVEKQQLVFEKDVLEGLQQTPKRLYSKYFYDANGLTMIDLPAPPKRCQELVDYLVASKGRPIGISDQVLIKLLIWHDEPAETRIRLMYSSAGICTLNFERLSEYRDYDLSQAKRD